MTDPVLTERQKEVLILIADGRTPSAIGKTLGISHYRVREITRRLCDVYDVDHLSELPGASGLDDFPDDGRIRVDGTDPTV